jgi:hypothetical protein
MQFKRGIWAAAVGAELALLYGWHQWFVKSGGVALIHAQLSYGAGFALFAALLLGALARFRVTAYPAFWRMLMLFIGAAVAALEIGMHGYGRAFFFPLWASALIGMAGVSIVARMLPRRFLILWFGGEFEQ